MALSDILETEQKLDRVAELEAWIARAVKVMHHVTGGTDYHPDTCKVCGEIEKLIEESKRR